MKVVIFVLLIVPMALWGQEFNRSEFGVSIGYMLEGEIYLAEPNFYGSVGETILIKAQYVGFMSNNFGMGGYGSYANPYYDGFGEISMGEFGIVLMGRFQAGDQFLIKPAGYLGYRTYGGGAGSGFGANAAVAFQYVQAEVKPFIELGFLSQPAGGNSASDITFSPTFQISAGVTF